MYESFLSVYFRFLNTSTLTKRFGLIAMTTLALGSYNTFFSVTCGLVVFSVLGYMSFIQNISIEDVVTEGFNFLLICLFIVKY